MLVAPPLRFPHGRSLCALRALQFDGSPSPTAAPSVASVGRVLLVFPPFFGKATKLAWEFENIIDRLFYCHLVLFEWCFLGENGGSKVFFSLNEFDL